MKKTMTVGVIAIASTLILTGCGQIKPPIQDTIPADAMMKESQKTIKQEDNMIKEDDAMMKKEDTMMKEENDTRMQKDDSMMKAGSYTTYSASAVNAALAAKKNVVLFFHAPWCPSCKAADTGLSNSTAPENMVVFKTDYDTNTELRKKYGVTSQHTFVSLNTDGSLKEKSSGEKNYTEIAELF